MRQRSSRTGPRRLIPILITAAVLAAVVPPVLASGTAHAASGDITADILANRNVTLSGDAVVNVPKGTTTYTGRISARAPSRSAVPAH